MPRRYSARDAERALSRIGFRFVRQTGSHMRFSARWRGEVRHVTITANQRVIPPKTLGDILYQAGIWPEEFEALVEGREIQE